MTKLKRRGRKISPLTMGMPGGDDPREVQGSVVGAALNTHPCILRGENLPLLVPGSVPRQSQCAQEACPDCSDNLCRDQDMPRRWRSCLRDHQAPEDKLCSHPAPHSLHWAPPHDSAEVPPPLRAARHSPRALLTGREGTEETSQRQAVMRGTQ